MNLFHRVNDVRSILPGLTALLSMAVFAAPARAQKQLGDDQSTLVHAQKTFATADGDMDGFLSASEARAAGIPEKEFASRDMDKSGTWATGEFLLYYRDLLLNSGKKPDAAFIAEVTRIEAAHRAREAEELRRRAQERLRQRPKAKTSGESTTDDEEGSDGESISQKLKRAREALKDRSKRADATRDSFDHTAGGLARRARGASGESEGEANEDAPDGDWAVKLRRARAALERRARDGHWTREQLQAADRRLVERARAAEQGVDLTALPASVRSKYERALVALTKRAQRGNWSREKYEVELADLLSRAKEELNARNGGDSAGENEAGEGAAGSDGEITQARRDYERALAALEERAKAGQWTRERYEAEREELAQRLRIRESNEGDQASGSSGDRAPVVRSKVDRAQEALDDRARRAEMDRRQHARITEELLERARESLRVVTAGAGADIRTKYERALSALITRAQKAGMTRAAFENERDQLIERARQEAGAGPAAAEDFELARKSLAGVTNGAGSDIRTKFERALSALITRAQKAGMTRAAFENERDQLIERARQEAGAGPAAAEDFELARKSLAGVTNGAGSDIRTKFERAMSALITRAQKAGMTRAAFENERDQLIERARQEAGAGGGDEVEAQGSGAGPGVRARRIETPVPVSREKKPILDKTKPKKPIEKEQKREKVVPGT